MGERFEYHHPCALAADIAVGLGVESLAPPFGREEPSFLEAREYLGQQNQIHAAGHRQFRFAVPDASAREMDCNQRGGTGRVDRKTRAAKIEVVRDAVSGDAGRASGNAIAVARSPSHRL